MPQSSNSRRVLFRLVLFTLAGWALWALGRDDAKPADQETAAEATPEPARTRTGFSKRRLATSLAFATLFFAGAAFTAGAGDKAASLLNGSAPIVLDPVGSQTGSTETTSTETQSTETQSTETESTETQSTETQSTETQSTETQSTETQSTETGPTENEGAGNADPTNPDDQSSEGDAAPASGGEDEPAAGNAPGGGGSGSQNEPAEVPDPPAAGPGSPSHTGDQVRSHVPVPEPVDVDAAHDAAVAAESAGSFGTFWLHRTLPDPTPPASRLKPSFARMLREVAAAHRVNWALVLGVIRARGHYDRVPASKREVARVAAALHRLHASQDAWQAVLALSGRTAFADRVVALARYNRAVGLRALVRGLLAAKASLQHRVLDDDRISIYAGGRSDIAAGKIDVRILALLRFLAEAHGSVTVSCLISGHGLYARPGVVSRHIYGEAVDIAALGGRSIYGNQEPGGLTERAVRNILLLPAELRPQQVISLLGLGGPSFALANHYDHIHVGF